MLFDPERLWQTDTFSFNRYLPVKYSLIQKGFDRQTDRQTHLVLIYICLSWALARYIQHDCFRESNCFKLFSLKLFSFNNLTSWALARYATWLFQRIKLFCTFRDEVRNFQLVIFTSCQQNLGCLYSIKRLCCPQTSSENHKKQKQMSHWMVNLCFS